MPQNNFPPDIHERLILDEPDLWDVDDFQGHKRMAIARGNTKQERIFEDTKTELPKLIAAVRWSLCQRPMREFAEEAGMSPNGYTPMEEDVTDNQMPHRSKYTRLLEQWETYGISTGIREQMLDLLTASGLLEMDEECHDLLSAIDYVREQSGHLLGMKELNAFYHRIGYEKGHDAVSEHFPKLYNTIWQRERSGTVPNYLELVTLINTMYGGNAKSDHAMRALRTAQAEALWSEVKKNQYLERGIEPPLASFLTATEMHLATQYKWDITDETGSKRTEGVTMTAEALRECLGFGPLQAERLIQHELIPTEDVAHAVKTVMTKKETEEILQEWQNAYEKEQHRPSFGKLASAAMKKYGLSAADIARILEVKSPEERGKKKRTRERSQRYRPDSEVRKVLFHHGVSRQIPVQGLIAVIASDVEHERKLTDAYTQERKRFFRRNGYTLQGKGLEMRIQRELANVPMTELAKQFLSEKDRDNKEKVRETDIELQKIERDETHNPIVPIKKVQKVLKQTTVERTIRALDRLAVMDEIDESLLEFASVQDVAANLVKGLKGGAREISEAMRDRARDDSEWLGSVQILQITRGEYVPTLPQMHMMLQCTTKDIRLPEEVIRDWYERFPQQLKDTGMPIFGQVRQPLPRMLNTLIATRESKPILFYKDRVPGIVPTHGTEHLRNLEAGKPVDWSHIHKVLLATGQKRNSVVYACAKKLHETGKLTPVLRDIVPELKRRKLEVHPMSLPGLTLKELKAFQ